MPNILIADGTPAVWQAERAAEQRPVAVPARAGWTERGDRLREPPLLS